MLEDFFVSKVRVKLLKLFFTNPGQMYHVREIVRQTDEEINAVRRELARLEKAGLLKSEWRANRRYYELQRHHVFYPELTRLIAKTTGLGAAILKNRSKLGRIKYAMLSLSFVSGKGDRSNEVNLFVVGDLVLPELGFLVREEESRRGSVVNYTPMSEEEFLFRKRRRDPFITSILTQPRVMLVGDEITMMEGLG